MPQIPSLPDVAGLGDLFSLFPDHIGHLLSYANGVLRGESEFTIGERELIATYVSGLNACAFCHDSHRIYAEAFGIDDTVIDALMEDVETAPIDEKMKPVLAYVQKLNFLPSRLVSADSQAVLDAGWSEKALFSAIQVCALFNMFNRLVEGSGVNFDYKKDASTHPASTLSPEEMANSYADFGRRLGMIE